MTTKPRRRTCKSHTKCPASYIAWHEWAEKKSRTHHQVQCDECGLWAIWIKGKAEEENPLP